MKINKITINDFKGIDTLEFKPKMINLIVGKNNTGKTSLLEAIDLLFNSEKIRDNKYMNDLININSESFSEIIANLGDGNKLQLQLKKSDYQELNIEFKNLIFESFKLSMNFKKIKFTEKMEQALESALNDFLDKEIHSILSKQSLTLVKNAEKKVLFSDSEEFSRVLIDTSKYLFKNLKLENKVILDNDYSLFLKVYSSRLLNIKQEINEKEVVFIKELKHIAKDDKTSEDTLKIHKIDNYLKKNKLINNLERFNLPRLIFKSKNNLLGTIPYEFMGDGFKVIVGLLWHLSSKNIKRKIILIEEPEKYTHPGYVKELVKYLIKFSRDENIQFFITSHSIDFIEFFLDEDIITSDDRKYLKKELRILRLEKLENNILPESLDYNGAKSNKEDLLLDLRGV
ncbi:MAG: AAA family ATPase [Spirochaetes bacterium]|nr:AAA family ATPase [Spirochaetota bacterium]